MVKVVWFWSPVALFTYIATLTISQEQCLTSWKSLQAHVRIKSPKPNEQDRNDTTILLHHPYILWHFANHAMCLLLECTDGVSHIWKAVEWAVLILQCMLLCMCMLLCILSDLHSNFTKFLPTIIPLINWAIPTYGSYHTSYYIVHGVICEWLQFHFCWAWQIWFVLYVGGCGVSSAESAVLVDVHEDVWESWWSILHSFIASDVHVACFVVFMVVKMAQEV